MRRVRAIVSCLHAATAEQATRVGVVGWVRNRGDGAVELEVEGTPAQVAELLAWCERGPPHARVARFTVEELSPVAAHLRERQFAIE